jgi:hypothetical protein
VWISSAEHSVNHRQKAVKVFDVYGGGGDVSLFGADIPAIIFS